MRETAPRTTAVPGAPLSAGVRPDAGARCWTELGALLDAATAAPRLDVPAGDAVEAALRLMVRDLAAWSAERWLAGEDAGWEARKGGVERLLAEAGTGEPGERARLRELVTLLPPAGAGANGLDRAITLLMEQSTAAEHRGERDEAMRWVAVAAAWPMPSLATAARLAQHVGRLLRHQSRWELSRAAYRRARRFARLGGDRIQRVHASGGSAFVDVVRGNLPAARRAFRRLLQASVGAPPSARAPLFHIAAICAERQGALGEALDLLHQALRLTPAPVEGLRIWGDVATVLVALGRFTEALPVLALVERASPEVAVADNAWLQRLRVRLALEDPTALQESAALEARLDRLPTGTQVEGLAVRAELARRAGDAAAALRWHERARARATELGLHQWEFRLDAAPPVSTATDAARTPEHHTATELAALASDQLATLVAV